MDGSTSDRSGRTPAIRQLMTLVAFAASMVLGLVPLLGPSSASAAIGDAPCDPSPIWAVTGGYGSPAVGPDLIKYAADGSVLSTVALRGPGNTNLTSPIGDIAWSTDGNTLYAVPFGATFGNQVPYLRTYDPLTGIQTSQVTLTGIDPSLTDRMNALTSAADGSLYLGIYGYNQIYKVDPGTGAVTPFAAFPSGVGSSGDFLTLPDGSIIAFGDDAGAADISHVYRISSDGSIVTWVGDVPRSFGAAQSGGDLYLLGHYGSQLLKLSIADIPTTVGTDPTLPTTVVTSAPSGDYLNGATSIDDHIGCGASYVVSKTVAPAPTVVPGETVTYTLVVRNTSSVPYTASAPAALTDDLGSVLDDATLAGSPSATGGTVTISGSVLTWEGPLAAQGSPGDTVTISYQVLVDAPSSGDGVLINQVQATGFGGSCDPDGVCSTSVDIVPPEPTFEVTKVADVPIASPGDVVTYTLTVTNTSDVAGPVVVEDVIAADMGITVGNFSLTAGVVDWSSPQLTWTIDSLPPGATAGFSYEVTLAATGTGTVHNVASIGDGDPCEAPTCAEVFVDVVDDPGVPLVSLPVVLGVAGVSGVVAVRRRRRTAEV